jgi:dTMP kinase
LDKNTEKKGKVIVIEGSDGSGKATQTKKLFDRLAGDGFSIRKVEYPNYGSESSALVKMYLGGEFGSKPDDVNPYAASSFYAVDRYASYKKEWEDFYFAGGIVLADRYTTANMVHQATKIDDPAMRESFLNWLWDYEFVKLGLPVPDCVIFLDVDPSCSRRLMENRSNKMNGEQDKDIHEKDPVFLQKSHASSCLVAEKYGWIRVSCLDSGELREIDDIHEEIYSRVINTL